MAVVAVAVSALLWGTLAQAAAASDAQADLKASQTGVRLDLRCAVSAANVAAGSRGAPAADLAQCARVAEVLDSANLRGAALTAWRNIAVAQPRMERAQLRVVQLLLESGDAGAAEKAAAEALDLLPKSSALYLLAAEAMLRQGKEYGARQLLVQGLSATGSVDVLSRLASLQDAHGHGAAGLYLKLAQSSRLPADRQEALLERGFTVALRDGEMAQAGELAARLRETGHSEFQSLLNRKVTAAHETLIPAGRDGLGFIAVVRNNASSDKFLAEYARALVANVCTGICFGPDEYKNMLEDYFAAVFELESLGIRDHRRVSIPISLKDPDQSRRTGRILNLLGLALHSENGVIRIEEGVKRRLARKQNMAAALGIDVIGMQQALQAGKSYTIELHDDPVEIYPNAGLWKDAFSSRWTASFPEMLLHSPEAARLYLSISEIDPETLKVLLASVSPGELATRFSQELARFGPALAISDHHAAVPGGPHAAPVWTQLVGVSPDQPGPFFRALLENSSLLAFFYSVSELDAQHQAFFTANADRALRFYTLSKGLVAANEFHRDLRVDTTFSRFLRSVPLDDNGHVIFPGSPGVWLVAKGAAANRQHISALQTEASREAPGAMEDSILSHLAETQYELAGFKNSELDNFLAVALLNAHLKEPMDDQSAILLAQHYLECWPLYVYFSDLAGVNHIGLANFFSVVDQIHRKAALTRNLEMGQLYALLGWVSVLSRMQALSGDQSVQLFSRIGEEMRVAVGRGSISETSLNLARSIVTACGEDPDREPGLDRAIRQCMLGKATSEGDPRSLDFQRVLELQSAPSLDALDSIADAAQQVLSTPGSARNPHEDPAAGSLPADAEKIARAAARLPAVKIPDNRRIPIREREAIQSYDPAQVQKYAADLKDIASRRNPSLNAAKEIAHQLLHAIFPQVTAALAAPIYAYYLRSTDLVVSEDPLLLRKHHYVDFPAPLAGNQVVDRSEFYASSSGIGSHFVGGFADFALIAGHAAAPAFRQGGQGAEAMIAAQIAAIRSVPWTRLTEDDQRLAALRILAAREWVVQSATDRDCFQALSKATVGLISLGRRADLLRAIENHDWDTAWASLPLPDLYTLGAEFSDWSLGPAGASPVFRELHALQASKSRSDVNYFGHIPNLAYGCGHLHFVPDAPYEEYARHLMQEDLAERTADFKLYIAFRADNLGVEPRELGRVAEKLAAKAFAGSQLSDYHDWRSLFAAYDSITSNDLKKALEP